LPTIDPAAEEDAIEIVGMDGSGTLAVDMTYAPASELESSYGGTVAEPEHGDEYLVLTAKVTVEEGTLNFNPAQFDVITPYGGAVSRSSESYSLKGSGSGGPLEFSEGEKYTIKLLFDVQRAGDNVLNFTTYTDDCKWDVPARPRLSASPPRRTGRSPRTTGGSRRRTSAPGPPGDRSRRGGGSGRRPPSAVVVRPRCRPPRTCPPA